MKRQMFNFFAEIYVPFVMCSNFINQSKMSQTVECKYLSDIDF